MSAPNQSARTADLVIYNGKIATQDHKRSFVTALAVAKGEIVENGNDHDMMQWAGDSTRRIDLKGRTVIPGLNDSHLHIIRGGLNFNLELRWDGVPLDMLRAQVARTPAPQWARVVGGWNEFQFAERRGPTLEEINAIAPDTPVFILHLYDSALLNAAALRAVGYDRDTPNPPGGEIQHDRRGKPAGRTGQPWNINTDFREQYGDQPPLGTEHRHPEIADSDFHGEQRRTDDGPERPRSRWSQVDQPCDQETQHHLGWYRHHHIDCGDHDTMPEARGV